ncbi:hypothetical protein OG777_19290 [Micromonospora peucetia]|uniref:Uncharacterized protein n=1 Tax=Micromonospora peucetia TaxID=47871 RepID=A0A1C6V2D0_9ACTN|nr:hypothetical protein [Micromonospora peucetia]MCX4389056.1 hypothetical protein [Micromonospora peucetia]SCL60501.1 hypothetical protein GA0070608_2321 [Micromonospora peucetia]
MAFLPLSGRWQSTETGSSPVRTGGENNSNHAKVSAAMEILLFLLFLVILAVASAAGLTADSRDSADWKPSDDGRRWRSRAC